MLKERTNHISSCARKEKKKKDLHTAREDRGGGRHTKGLCSCWKTSFNSAEGQLFSACLSHTWTDHVQGEVCWKDLAEYLYFAVLTLISSEIFHQLPFFDTEIISSLIITCSTLATRRVRISSPSPLFTSILVANVGPNVPNCQWFLHCRRLL